jgi:hypothetical protein
VAAAESSVVEAVLEAATTSEAEVRLDHRQFCLDRRLHLREPCLRTLRLVVVFIDIAHIFKKKKGNYDGRPLLVNPSSALHGSGGSPISELQVKVINYKLNFFLLGVSTAHFTGKNWRSTSTGRWGNCPRRERSNGRSGWGKLLIKNLLNYMVILEWTPSPRAQQAARWGKTICYLKFI